MHSMPFKVFQKKEQRVLKASGQVVSALNVDLSFLRLARIEGLDDLLNCPLRLLLPFTHGVTSAARNGNALDFSIESNTGSAKAGTGHKLADIVDDPLLTGDDPDRNAFTILFR
jgi:hypothetical protein